MPQRARSVAADWALQGSTGEPGAGGPSDNGLGLDASSRGGIGSKRVVGDA